MAAVSVKRSNTKVTNRAESDRCGEFDHIFRFHLGEIRTKLAHTGCVWKWLGHGAQRGCP